MTATADTSTEYKPSLGDKVRVTIEAYVDRVIPDTGVHLNERPDGTGALHYISTRAGDIFELLEVAPPEPVIVFGPDMDVRGKGDGDIYHLAQTGYIYRGRWNESDDVADGHFTSEHFDLVKATR